MDNKITLIIDNALIVNEGRSFMGYVVVCGEFIETVGAGRCPEELIKGAKVLNVNGATVMPGVIDDQVHFREPGLTQKADIHSESVAAVAGGVTSFMEMPNTIPQTTTLELLEQKNQLAAEKSVANYSFYLGATNDNIEQILSVNPKETCGIKLFMGSSTGNMLVNNEMSLERIFAESPVLLATHCEDEATVKANLEKFKELYGENIKPEMHPLIRNAEACYKSSAKAVELAAKHGTNLHVLHISSEKEMSLFESKSLEQKKITCEVCVHHLYLSENDYARKGNFIKWNPAIKSEADRNSLRESLKNGKIDVVATDHAPHLLEEKMQPYLSAPSGGPLVQHSLPLMMTMAAQGVFSRELVVEKMSHAPALLYKVDRRGFIRKGYYADLVVVDEKDSWIVDKENVLYKCKWSPLEGETLTAKVKYTIISGKIVNDNGVVDSSFRGNKLLFNR